MAIERIAAYGLPIPEMYRVSTEEEADLMKENGLPYIITDVPIKTLIQMMMLPLLKKHYPGINWNKFFRRNHNDFRNIIVNVPGGSFSREESDQEDEDSKQHVQVLEEAEQRRVDSAESERLFEGTPKESYTISLDRVIQDDSAEIDPRVLSDFNLLPHFLGDIESVIRRNLYNAQWTEGYNKKLRCPVGTFSGSKEARNLLIVDISQSIPDGISATLLTLLDTMKHMANADVIVTGSESYYWAADKKLPSAKELRESIGYGNESRMFRRILYENIVGRHFGNVIVFGDYDTPYLHENNWADKPRQIAETQVDRLMCYHTREKSVPGYGKWAVQSAKKIDYDLDWCRFML